MSQLKTGEPPMYPPYDPNAPVVYNQPMPQPIQQQQQQQQQKNTVIVQQPPPPQYGLRDWNFGLFDCFDDLPICLCGYFCSLCLACKVSQDMGESACVPFCLPLPIAILRTKWRTQQNIQGSIMEDCVMSAFCGACSLCQLAREVKLAQQIM